MRRKAFYSFHYEPDCTRASLVRNIGAVEGNPPVSDNDWEAITRGGGKAIQKWINEQLRGCSCTIVLVGQNTSQREWIKYEIKKSWDDGKGVFGIYIHRLKNLAGEQASKGKNPFAHIKIPWWPFFEQNLANVVKVYEPPHRDSKKAYKYISENISDWIDEAISIRNDW